MCSLKFNLSFRNLFECFGKGDTGNRKMRQIHLGNSRSDRHILWGHIDLDFSIGQWGDLQARVHRMQLGRNEIIGVGSKHSMPGASGEFGERPFPQGFALA